MSNSLTTRCSSSLLARRGLGGIWTKGAVKARPGSEAELATLSHPRKLETTTAILMPQGILG